MSASNRTELISKTYKVLKKHYEPSPGSDNRPLLEQLLYACCLEGAKSEKADEAFAKLQQMYTDWNEVRVTTVSELSEVMSVLPDAPEAGKRLKRSLQGVFETYYSFDIDSLQKQNLGKAVKEFEKNKGVTPFVIAYLVQHGLGGHSIPTNLGALQVFEVLGVISKLKPETTRVPGLERTIPKTKGVEFSSLLHQLAVDYFTSPFSPRVRAILLEINPDAKDRFPKRGGKKADKVKENPVKKKAEAKKKKEEPKKEAKKKTTAAPTPKKVAAPKKPAASKKSAAPKKAAVKKKPVPPKKAAVKKKPAPTKKKAAPAKAKQKTDKKKSATKRLARKKPR